jgi:hemolysin type calcium-binding protein
MRRKILLPAVVTALFVLTGIAFASHGILCRDAQTEFHAFTVWNGTSAAECVGEASTAIGADNVWDGSTGRDTLVSGTGVDQLHGKFGADDLYGQGHGDFLYGEADDDAIFSGATAADDYMNGGDGNDEFWGGLGNDNFVGGPGFDIIHHCHDALGDTASGIEQHVHLPDADPECN